MTSFSSVFFSLLLLSSCFLCRVYLQLVRISKVPRGIPWAGTKSDSTLSKLRACFWEPFARRKNIQEGYEKYGRHGIPFILPAIHWPGVVLPPSNAKWVSSQPDEVLNHIKPFNDLGGFDCLAHGPNIEAVHDFTVLRRNLTRQMRTLVPQSLDEIGTAIDEQLGLDCGDWKEVKVADFFQHISFRAGNRLFVGNPLCRNKQYQAAVDHWAIAFAVTITLIRSLIPFPWKRLIAPVLAIPATLLQYRVKRYILPDVRQRIAKFKARDPGKQVDDTDNDMMQWIIDTNAMKANPDELSPSNVAGKMILLNLFAVNTTSVVAATLFMDLLSQPSAPAMIASLRKEAEESLPRIVADPSMLRTMWKTDSVIRETLRYDPFMAQVMVREVMTPEGVTTPDGLHLPQNCHIHTIVSSMQRDESKLSDANKFLPFRYYDEGLETGKQRTAVQLDEKFLTFSLGKHACPGRFFAVHSLKLIISYLLCNYDIELTTNSQNPFLEIGEGRIPSSKTSIRCRRRRATVKSSTADL